MNLTNLRPSPGFWDRIAPWYEKWASRGTYHSAILKELIQMVEQGWQVMDIGAGTGVLSLPIAAMGCSITAIEPSEGMRSLFRTKLGAAGTHNVTIVGKRWEDFQTDKESSQDLIIACNSLHLTEGGMSEGMTKVFSSRARYACLITEINQNIFIDFKDIDALQSTYTFLYIRNYAADSTFYFEDIHEVRELEAVLNSRIPIAMENGKPVHRDHADIAVVWWEKRTH